MKKRLMLSLLAVVALPAHAAATKTYQVTGPVTDISGGNITVQKGSEKWQLALGTTAVPAGVVVGSKVTIQYTMTAASIVSKDAGAATPAGTAAPTAK